MSYFSLWGRGNAIYLNLTEEDFVPHAVAANDPAADLSTFSLCSEVEQPALQWGVSLAENLPTTKHSDSDLFGTVLSIMWNTGPIY